MALSGTVRKASGNSKYSLEIRWTAKQSTSGNYSDVSAELWFIAEGSWTLDVSSRSGNIIIDGTTFSFSKGISGGTQRLHTASKRVTHGSDGKKKLAVSGTYNFNITIGSALGSPVASDTWDLTDIPRASSVTSGISWTAGTQNLAITVNSASTGFTHIASVYIVNPSGAWEYIGETLSFGTSTTFAFDTTHITRMYQAIGGSETRPAKISLKTYSGGTHIGTSEKTGTVYGVPIAKISFSNFNIGDSIPVSISPMYTGFTYTGEMVFGSFKKPLTFSPGTPNPTITFTTAEKDAMFAQVSNVSSGVGTVTIFSRFNGVDVNDGLPAPAYDPRFNFTAFVTNSNPTFTGSGVTYSDTNATTAGVTGVNTPAYIIQNKSKLRVTIPVASRALAVNGASITGYEVQIAGKTVTASYSTTAVVNIDINEINTNTDAIMQLYAVDSRGNKTAVPITVKILPYATPVLRTTVVRTDSFGELTTIALNGSVAPLAIGASNKNSIVSVRYQFKVSGAADSTYSTLKSFPSLTGFPNYTAGTATELFPIGAAYDVKIVVTDKLEPATIVRTVSAGVPIVFMDPDKKSVGIGMLPTKDDALEIAKDLFVGGHHLFDRGRANYAKIYWNASSTANFGLVFQDDGQTVMTLRAGAETSTLQGDFNVIGKFTEGSKPVVTIDSTGTNANGTYIRYTDGTQICYMEVTESNIAFALYNAPIYIGSRVWTFPATFSSLPTVTCSEFRWGNSSSWGSVGIQPSTTSVTLRGQDSALRATGTPVNISAMAIGRWK